MSRTIGIVAIAVTTVIATHLLLLLSGATIPMLTLSASVVYAKKNSDRSSNNSGSANNGDNGNYKSGDNSKSRFTDNSNPISHGSDDNDSVKPSTATLRLY